jgi:pimeloyl-ACP methyl ester carboxylesterase
MPLLLILLVLLSAILIYLFASGPKLPPETDEIIDGVSQSELPEFVTGSTGYASSDGLRIWYESIPPQGPPKGTILLIMSNAGDALEWPPKFVRAFVDSGYRVVRYDHRGTGMSDWVEDWDRKKPYSIADMAGDAAAVLDSLKIEQAHVIGLSLGGMVAQELAINHPGRVASLTLMATSGYIGDPDLPNLSSRYFLTSLVKGLPLLKYRIAGGEKNLIKERIAKTIVFLGYEGLDIKEIAELVIYDLRKRRGLNLKAVFQHQVAVTNSGSRYARLKSVDAPTLVIHGTADQLIPVEHGKKLVDLIPNAQGLWLKNVGHAFLFQKMGVVNGRILAHMEEARTP